MNRDEIKLFSYIVNNEENGDNEYFYNEMICTPLGIADLSISGEAVIMI